MNGEAKSTTTESEAVALHPPCSALDWRTGNQVKWLLREMDKSAKLKAADNRKILWLAMQTEPWLNCDPMSTAADILAELESRMYPEYDGESVTFHEWGWQTPDGEIRYLPNAPHELPPTKTP